MTMLYTLSLCISCTPDDMEYNCHHASKRRVDPAKNAKGKSKNWGCSAKLKISIKHTTKDTRKKDKYVKEGMPAFILFKEDHNHSLTSSESLAYLRPGGKVREQFETYFDSGLGITEAIQYHEAKLEMKYGVGSAELRNALVNPRYRTVAFWYRKWRSLNSKPLLGKGIPERLQKSVKQKANEEIYEIQSKIIKIGDVDAQTRNTDGSNCVIDIKPEAATHTYPDEDLHVQNDNKYNIPENYTNDLFVDTTNDLVIKQEILTLASDQHSAQWVPDTIQELPSTSATISQPSASGNLSHKDNSWECHYWYMRVAYDQLCQHIPLESRVVLLQKMLDESMPQEQSKPLLRATNAGCSNNSTDTNGKQTDSILNSSVDSLAIKDEYESSNSDDNDISQEHCRKPFEKIYTNDDQGEGSSQSGCPIDRNEALGCAEKLYRWMTGSSETTVTDTQIREVKNIIDRLKWKS